MHQTIIEPELPSADGLKAKASVEPMRPRITRKRVNDDCGDTLIREASRQRQTHHLAAEASTQIALLANPDIDRSQVRFDFPPVVPFLECRIDDLNKPDRTTRIFRDQLLTPRGAFFQLSFPTPVVMGIRCDDVRLFIPTIE